MRSSCTSGSTQGMCRTRSDTHCNQLPPFRCTETSSSSTSHLSSSTGTCRSSCRPARSRLCCGCCSLSRRTAGCSSGTRRSQRYKHHSSLMRLPAMGTGRTSRHTTSSGMCSCNQCVSCLSQSRHDCCSCSGLYKLGSTMDMCQTQEDKQHSRLQGHMEDCRWRSLPHSSCLCMCRSSLDSFPKHSQNDWYNLQMQCRREDSYSRNPQTQLRMRHSSLTCCSCLRSRCSFLPSTCCCTNSCTHFACSRQRYLHCRCSLLRSCRSASSWALCR